ncbi:hypothetical protein K469DRAFT_637605, partial [Zopfia rhizophila CBS 207.26]
YVVLDYGGVERGWIQYDVEKHKDEEGKDLCKEQCVVAGKNSNKNVEEYYVLVVRSTGVDGGCVRIGVGLIQSDYVVRQRLNVRVV